MLLILSSIALCKEAAYRLTGLGISQLISHTIRSPISTTHIIISALKTLQNITDEPGVNIDIPRADLIHLTRLHNDDTTTLCLVLLSRHPSPDNLKDNPALLDFAIDHIQSLKNVLPCLNFFRSHLPYLSSTWFHRFPIDAFLILLAHSNPHIRMKVIQCVALVSSFHTKSLTRLESLQIKCISAVAESLSQSTHTPCFETKCIALADILQQCPSFADQAQEVIPTLLCCPFSVSTLKPLAALSAHIELNRICILSAINFKNLISCVQSSDNEILL